MNAPLRQVTLDQFCATVRSRVIVEMHEYRGDIFAHLDDGRILLFTVVDGTLAVGLAPTSALQ